MTSVDRTWIAFIYVKIYLLSSYLYKTLKWKPLKVQVNWLQPQANRLYMLVTQLCPTLCGLMDCSPRGSFVHGDSSRKNTGVGCHFLLQGVFPTQGRNLGMEPRDLGSSCRNSGLLHYRQILYHLSHQGSPINIWGTFKNLILKQCLCMVVTIILSTENVSLQSLRNKPKIIQIIDDRK